MNNRYKVVSGLMALAAVFLVIVGFKFISNNADFNFNFKNPIANLSFESNDDWDNDGLNNREESYWNTDPNNPDTDGDEYLDGEEVLSGHDPLIQAPNDLVDNENLTSKLSGLALAGLYEGSLKPKSPNYEKSLNDLAETIVNEAAGSLRNQFDYSGLKVVKSTKEDLMNYVDNFSSLLNDSFTILEDEMENLVKNLDVIGASGFNNDLTVYFTSKKTQFETIKARGVAMGIPKEFQQQHVDFLKIINDIIVINNVISLGANDPIKALVAINSLPSFINRLSNLVDTYDEKINILQ